ncbi:LysR family transcriptional regulator [Woodsholea maritima]|uniref:LysR family transcriptional regulator n=1 Tax=Woodsholea maritima TaxID=240237 RepID=UPI000377DB51|nr:LysR family transcriptional regulator [Woodsholea maritima]
MVSHGDFPVATLSLSRGSGGGKPVAMKEISLVHIVRQVDVRDLEVLLTVAEECSFRKAGKHLEIGQSAVSRRVQKLENLLGVSLFERQPTGARLTAAGSEFVDCASTIYDNLKAGVTRAQSNAIAGDGELRIGTMFSLSNGSQRALIEAFAKSHPAVHLSFVECGRRQMMTMLGHREIDAVIAIGASPCQTSDHLVLAYTPVYLAVAGNSSLASVGRLRWADVVNEKFVVSARDSGSELHDYIVRQVTEFGRGVSITRHHICREGIMNLVGLGFGVTLVCDHALGARYPNVSLAPIGHEEECVPLSLSWRPENDNPALRRFIGLARRQARQNCASCCGTKSPDHIENTASILT